MKNKPVKINLGCGGYKLDGFINVDIDIKVEPDVVADVKNLLGVGKAEVIYAGHLLEHFDYNVGLQLLKRWREWLIEGGEIYIVVPDIDIFVKNYLEGTFVFGQLQQGCFGYGIGVDAMEKDRHKAMFNYDVLKKMLQDAGYKDVHKFDYNVCPYVLSKAAEQLCVKATK